MSKCNRATRRAVQNILTAYTGARIDAQVRYSTAIAKGGSDASREARQTLFTEQGAGFSRAREAILHLIEQGGVPE